MNEVEMNIKEIYDIIGLTRFSWLKKFDIILIEVKYYDRNRTNA